jgi:hypothetical protein
MSMSSFLHTVDLHSVLLLKQLMSFHNYPLPLGVLVRLHLKDTPPWMIHLQVALLMED